MGAVARFSELQEARFDHWLRAGFMNEAVGQWLVARLQMLSNVVLGSAALLCVVFGEQARRPRPISPQSEV